MITENLSTLKIHKLTKAQYERELKAGNIDESALYLTPDEDALIIDTTLSIEGQAADAKAVGDAIANIEIPEVEGFVSYDKEQNLTDEQKAQVRKNISKYNWREGLFSGAIEFKYCDMLNHINWDVAGDMQDTYGFGNNIVEYMAYMSQMAFDAMISQDMTNIITRIAVNYNALKSAGGLTTDSVTFGCPDDKDDLAFAMRIYGKYGTEGGVNVVISTNNVNNNVKTGSWSYSPDGTISSSVAANNIDASLSKENYYADAKAVGDVISSLNNSGFVTQDTPPEDTSVLWVDTSDDSVDGGEYTITDEDKAEIAEMAAEMVEVPESGGNVELDTTLTQSGKAADAKAVGDAVEKISNEINSIANLETTVGDSTVNVTGWTKGRIESGVHKDVAWMAYSEMLPITSATFHFDATAYKFMYISYDADGNKKYAPSSWITESPVVVETPYAYLRAQVTKIETVKFTDEQFADLPNKVTYTVEGQGEATAKVPIVNAVISLASVNTTRYVDCTIGSDDNPGTADAPFATIQKGVDSGTKLLYVAPGDYPEYVHISERDELTILPATYPETYDITAPETPMIRIAGTADNRIGRAMLIQNCGKISITGVWGDYTKWEVFSAINVKDLTMVGCYASNNETISAFKANNTNAVYRRCKAWNSATDGFGFTNHGDVRLYDCIAYDCADDGVSHHNSCTGMIVGGEFYNCGKGGVASPTYGSHVDVMGVYSHDNVYGLYAMNDADRRESVGRVTGCVFRNNTTADLRIGQNCTVTGWSNVYQTKSVMDAATYIEIDDGKTPVRGTDYWTDADKAEIKAYVDEAIMGGAW